MLLPGPYGYVAAAYAAFRLELARTEKVSPGVPLGVLPEHIRRLTAPRSSRYRAPSVHR